MKAARFVLLILYISGFSFNLPAQTETNSNDDEIIEIETQFVEVPIVVTDKSGKPILNLKQNNFVIYEDGKKQEVTDFLATAAPFEVALLLDTTVRRAPVSRLSNAPPKTLSHRFVRATVFRLFHLKRCRK